jgi:hypothetical protein
MSLIGKIVDKFPGITIGELRWAEDKTWNEKVAANA